MKLLKTPWIYLAPLVMAGLTCIAKPLPPSSLTIIDKEGRPTAACPLKRTEMKGEITGFLARVTVTQSFENPLNENIEAVYAFPLPHSAAVDDMTMLVGDRIIKGKIKPREEARAIYDAARQSGRTASMLEQERPNIFTQSVANIRPGEKIRIVISYVETLKYEAGSYEFVFPMVVAPRYIPGRRATGVPDASRITPPVTPEGTRAGHDVTLEISLDAGVPVDALLCTSHDVVTERPAASRAVVRLKQQAVIPNKDFVLKYDVAGKKIEDAVLAYRSSRGGFFTLILQPPERVTPSEITPKELVFVLDTSGSMSGYPMEKSKEVMRMALTHMNPQDTFNIITFAGDTAILFPQPVPATQENIEKARQFVEGRRGSGGTEMMKAIRAALDPTNSQQHVRVVAFLTDGEVGNDMEIIAEVKKHTNARVFSFGIGSSINRFLLAKMAEYGRGEAEFVTLQDDGSAAARRFFERMRSPLLTDVRVDWGGAAVSDVYPKQIPDLFSAKPVVVYGRYAGPVKGPVRILGKMAGREFSRTVNLDLPAAEPRHDTLASLWARTKIDDLMGQDYRGIQNGRLSGDLRNQIMKVGLDYRLMTQFTAFVAVEERTLTENGKPPRRIEVPVEMPEGMSYRGVFGEPSEIGDRAISSAPLTIMHRTRQMSSMPYSPSQPKLANEAAERREDAAAAPSRLHPDLADAVKQGPGARKVEVKIYLSDVSSAVLQILKGAGLEITRSEEANRMVLGRIALDKLEAIAKLTKVRFISPAV
ncbi:MAG TPA: VIT domain-containing protein [Bryobacteraceae bacterium]|nr:VIT domain-containing protein [Bryobacteraceae bacterium]